MERNIYGKATRDGSGVKLLRSPAIAKPLLSDVTRSVFRGRLTSWLSTPEAAAWREQRKSLDHPDEEAASQKKFALARLGSFSVNSACAMGFWRYVKKSFVGVVAHARRLLRGPSGDANAARPSCPIPHDTQLHKHPPT